MAKNLLYLSCHETLEYEELSYFKEFGFNIFSAGYYLDPKNPFRISKRNLDFNVDPSLIQEFLKLNPNFKPSNPVKLSKEFVKHFDIIVCCHFVENFEENWDFIKDKIVIRRAIGLSSSEMELLFHKFSGIKTVRVSARERLVPNFIGEDVIIPGSANPSEYKDWIGNELSVLTIQKWMKKSSWYTRFDIYEEVTNGFNRKLCGFDNQDIPYAINNVPIDELQALLKSCRVYFSTCSRPAALTYTFVEAWMAGIPVVSIGSKLGNVHSPSNGLCFEPPYLIDNGINGFVSDDIRELRSYIQLLLSDYDLAKKISHAGREKAIKLFSPDIIKTKWKTFLHSINALP